MWPLGTLITKKVLLLFLIEKIWTERVVWKLLLNKSFEYKETCLFNRVHHLNPYLFMSPVLKRDTSCIDMNFEAMCFTLKVGEQNKGPLKLAPDVKTLVGAPHQNKRIITPLLSHRQPVTSLSNASWKVKLLHRKLRYLFQAKLAPQSLVTFDLTGHPGIKCRTLPSPLYAG